MWYIVWVLPEGHRSVSASRHFLLQAPQCPCSVRKRFSRDHCCTEVGSLTTEDTRLKRVKNDTSARPLYLALASCELDLWPFASELLWRNGYQVRLKFVRQFLRYLTKSDFCYLFWPPMTLTFDFWPHSWPFHVLWTTCANLHQNIVFTIWQLTDERTDKRTDR